MLFAKNGFDTAENEPSKVCCSTTHLDCDSIPYLHLRLRSVIAIFPFAKFLVQIGCSFDQMGC